MANTYVNKVVQSDGTVLMDITDTTATADKILSGYTAYGANGEKITGTASSGGGAGGVAMIVDTLDAAGGTIREITATELTQAQEGKVVSNGALVSQSSATYTENDTYDTTLVNSVTVDVPDPSVKKVVYFFDYDGIEIASYTGSEFSRLSALPANPTHTGITSQGWNWTKSQIESQLTAYPDVPINVGQMYTTSSTNTEIDITFIDSERIAPYLSICVNGTVDIDWGDGSYGDTVTGSSLTYNKFIQHVYAAVGDYTISISADSGSYFTFYGGTNNYYTVLTRKATTSTSANTNSAYSSCIRNIRLGSGITSVGNYAFQNCYNLESITIPSSVTSIGTYAFQNCYNLCSITIPSSVTSIGDYAFYSCYSLAPINIPSGVTSIGNNAFSSCYKLESITIPVGVTSIGNSIFQYCRFLKSVTIPNSVTSIGTNIFQYCNVLSSVTISSNVTTIDSRTFDNCNALESITIPSSVTSIGTYAFYCCYSLSSITIPSSVTSIGTYVFYNCHRLKSITIPSGVTSIGAYEFQACYSLAQITIPSGVTSIGNYAFQNCYSLKSVTIPNSVTSIGTYAFYSCYSLAQITIPSGVTSIESYAFQACCSLASINIPSGVTSIKTYAFYNCYNIKTFTIPSSVTSIGTYVFYNCSGVKEYHVLPTTPPSLGANNWTGISSDCVIYVPYSEDHSILNAYKTKTNWSSQASKIQEEPQS